MSSQKFPHLLPKNYLIAIGSLSTYYAYLESILEISIWAFLGLLREDGALVTTHLGMVMKQDILYALVRKRFEKKDPRYIYLKQLLDKVELLRTERNNIIHGFYKRTKRGPIEAIKTKAKKELIDDVFNITLDEINTTTYETWSIVNDFQEALSLEFPNYRFPWPAKPPEPVQE